jgi:integrase
MRTPDKPWFRKQNQTWYAKINGKQIRLSKDRAEAKRIFHRLVSEGGLPKDRPFRECMAHYLSTLGPESRRTREQILTAFQAHIGTIRSGKLTKRHVSSFLKPAWSPSTKRTAIKTILACLNRCKKDGLIESNPIKDIEKPAWERREKILTTEELQKLLEAAREPFKTLLIAMVESGCRPGEICKLRVEDCFLEDGIWLVANKTKNQTGVKKRPVYLSGRLVDLTRRCIGSRTEGYAFLNRDGAPWQTDTVRCRFRRLRDKLGLSDGVIPYGTRHRFASDAINRKGIDSLVVARLLGHSDARMLERTYFREDTDAMRRVVEEVTK